MARQAKDDEREERIQMEIIVDAYGPEEQALGWYYYLEGTLQFPFTARCIARHARRHQGRAGGSSVVSGRCS